MRAVACREAELEVVDIPEPVPAKGQVRIGTLRCGICGSDLHARHGIDDWAELTQQMGYDRFGRSSQAIVFGHEFCGEVLEYGPGCRAALSTGSHVVALPLIRGPRGIDPVGLCESAPGAYAEQLLVQESLMMAVPNGLGPDVSALTEPMAVAWHAVRRGEVSRRTEAIVVGCGPVGLSVILLLKARGVRTVIAADFSGARRDLARRCGADIVVDPAVGSPYTAGGQDGLLRDAPSAFELAVGTVERLRRVPGGWWRAWGLADRLGLANPKKPVVFECVGVPGVISSIVDAAPLFSRVVVVGVCVGADRFRPAMAINKEIEMRFVLGYTPLEFREALIMLAEGVVDPHPLLTGTVGLDGVAGAFDALASPERHAKILVDPALRGTAPGLPAA